MELFQNPSSKLVGNDNAERFSPLEVGLNCSEKILGAAGLTLTDVFCNGLECGVR